jgi:hypothetical protein
MSDRREFLGEVGEGMLVALVGSGLAADMGLASRAQAVEAAPRTADRIERLVSLLQETPPQKLMPTLVGVLREGVVLRDLVAAGALCNARAFGGHDYDGYHTFMAMAPAFAMAQELNEKERALPVLKVLHRNARTMGSGPNNKKPDRLRPVEPAELKADQPVGKLLVDATRAKRIDEADRLFVAAAANSLDGAYNELQDIIHDDVNVHRVVLAWRSWETLDFTGKEHARTLLRQSIHFCCDENQGGNRGIRTALPQMMDKYKLMDKTPGRKEADDAWVDKLAQTIHGTSREQAAEAVAHALAEGYSPEVIGEAMSLACARLVLSDPGRVKPGNADKVIGSVHGDSVGVHASDSANAWRHIARVSNPRNTFASLIAGAYHTAGQSGGHMKELYPQGADLEKITDKEPAALLKLTEEAITAKDQRRACAIAHAYGKQGYDARDMFSLLLRFAVANEGALHAEKYFRTAAEEFAVLRPAFRWQHVVALARVSASLSGTPGQGVEEARKLLLA